MFHGFGSDGPLNTHRTVSTHTFASSPVGVYRFGESGKPPHRYTVTRSPAHDRRALRAETFHSRRSHRHPWSRRGTQRRIRTRSRVFAAGAGRRRLGSDERLADLEHSDHVSLFARLRGLRPRARVQLASLPMPARVERCARRTLHTTTTTCTSISSTDETTMDPHHSSSRSQDCDTTASSAGEADTASSVAAIFFSRRDAKVPACASPTSATSR